YSQGGSIADANMYVVFRNASPLFRLLRLRFIFNVKDGQLTVTETSGALPHLVLVNDWHQVQDPTQILKTLADRSFDPEKTMILETPPAPMPAPGVASGTVRLLTEDANSLTIAADVPRPTLLLVTDAYSRYWKAVALQGS